MKRSPDVLIIDDDPHFVGSACEALRKRGLSVRGVLTAEEGLEALAQGHRPKLIVVDLVLPGMGARDFVATVRREIAWSQLPFVLVTAGAAEEVPADLPADGLLLKPVEASQLANLVHRYCGRA